MYCIPVQGIAVSMGPILYEKLIKFMFACILIFIKIWKWTILGNFKSKIAMCKVFVNVARPV